jgi:hypothetical protein
MTAAYVRKRLTDAGARLEIFTADGLAQVHKLTGGLVRSIDVLGLSRPRRSAWTSTRTRSVSKRPSPRPAPEC